MSISGLRGWSAIVVCSSIMGCRNPTTAPVEVASENAPLAEAERPQGSRDCASFEKVSATLGKPRERDAEGLVPGHAPGACAPETLPSALTSCSDERALRASMWHSEKGDEIGCVVLDGGEVVAATWRTIGDAPATLRLEGMIYFYTGGKTQWYRTLRVDGSDAASALAASESTALTASLEGKDLLRVGVVARHGEDEASTDELVELFEMPHGKKLWSGVGTTSATELDACTTSRVATFRLTADRKTIERREEPRAVFTPQPLEAQVVARIRKGCVPDKAGPRTALLPVAEF